ncbi:hypothetical protein O6H91_12G091500 [Diphasiastrum complanatum]|uniref:Uncharacterized protein n=1 Tax=Diphasiastrum complanatum TaxID=34168 RepID=A0ACC2C4T1_DIPCM|nr:hypothetical protein O6H91_12G091500 [Diphasiastrum complanatum]
MSGDDGFFNQSKDNIDYGTDNQAGDYGSNVTQEGDGVNYDNSYKKGGNYGSTDNQDGYGGGNYNQQDSYGDDTYQKPTGVSDTTGYDEQASNVDAQENVDKYSRNEHLGEGGALAAGAYALYERHEAKEDPENAGRHTIEEDVGAATAVGAAGYAAYEHHQKEGAEDEEENAEGKKPSSWFG